MVASTSDALKKRKPRPDQRRATSFKPKKPQNVANIPKTTAKKLKQPKEDLTLSDWLEVFDYIEAHPEIRRQQDVVDYFKNRASGALFFSQSALSKKLKVKDQLRNSARVDPSALSRKRARVVTRPDIDQALALWQDSMEKKGESVTGPMLVEKRKRFEVLFNVPEAEQLKGTGWLVSFKNAYQLKERRRHGEAGSVDIRAVEVERDRMRKWNSKFAPEDRFNVDETSFFPSAPPDRSLCKKSMSGKKVDRFRITAVFCCNSTGTEKLPILFIGKSKKPRCFNKQDPEKMSPPLYYRSNKTAWMTGGLFDEWLRKFDLRMNSQDRDVGLSLDNFSGHYVEYEPQNAEVQFFQPNLTSHVQPCDAGIIRCVKARYRTLLALRALDREEAGEEDIYKIDVLTAMRLLTQAWDEVTPETIQNCWKHSGVSPGDDEEWEDIFIADDAPDVDFDVEMDEPLNGSEQDSVKNGWKIILEYAASDWTFKVAEAKLKNHLGDSYNPAQWQPALFAVMEAESSDDATEAIQALMPRPTHPTGTKSQGPSKRVSAISAEVQRAEKEVMECIGELYKRGHLVNMPTLDEVVDPDIEREDHDSEVVDNFADGEKGLREIRDYVVNKGKEDAEEQDSDGEDDEPPFEMDRTKVLEAAQYLQTVCQNRGDLDTAFDLSRSLLRFRGEMRREAAASKTQASISSYFTRK